MNDAWATVRENLPAIATDETRAGERGMSPFELRKMLSGEGAYDLGHIPRVVSGGLDRPSRERRLSLGGDPINLRIIPEY